MSVLFISRSWYDIFNDGSKNFKWVCITACLLPDTKLSESASTEESEDSSENGSGLQSSSDASVSWYDDDPIAEPGLELENKALNMAEQGLVKVKLVVRKCIFQAGCLLIHPTFTLFTSIAPRIRCSKFRFI